MSKYQIQHEFDFEPTYIVTPPDSENEVVTLSEQLPWELRLPLARLLASVLRLQDPVAAAVHLEAVAKAMEKNSD